MRIRAITAWMLIGVASVVATAQSDEQIIRDARAASNAAIARHDTAGVARFWMDDIHITTSTSAHATGRSPNADRMTRQFQRRSDTIYVRTPTAIEVFADWQVASERGEWVGRWTEPDGKLEISGTYLAQWRRINGQWLIQAELFVPTKCQGSQYCRQRP